MIPKTNNIDPEVEFPKVEKMLYALAWKYAKTYPVTFEEARSEVFFAFMRACGDFKPERGMKFSSWCYTWAWQHLKTWVTKRTVDPLEFVEIKEELLGEAPPERSDLLDLASELSGDAQEIVNLLIEIPEEFHGVSMTAKQLMKRVKDYLVRKGRNRQHVDRAHQEICLCFQRALT